MNRLLAALCCIALASGACAGAGSARAGGSGAEPGTDGGWRLAVGVFAGGLAVDQRLENYRWDTRPAMQTGVQATVYRGRFAAGARLWGSRTTQAIGIPGTGESPRVNLTGVEGVGRVRLFDISRVELWGSGHAGRIHLGYSPDQLTIDTGVLADPITVAFDPIAEWEFGFGAGLRGEVTEHLAVSLDAERSSFALDTAHRRGEEIVESRDWFHSWSLRLQVSWLLTLG